jgi:large subunit ribosomal protein L4
MKLPVFDVNAKKIEDIEVNQEVFGTDVSEKVIAQYVYSYLSNQRESNADTKDRAEVRGGGKKPWRQKGTGRARHGSSRSPIWRGGGVTFGPMNERNYKKKLTKSFRRAAFRNIFSKLALDSNVSLVDGFTKQKEDLKTKDAVKMLNSFGDPKKSTIVLTEKNNGMLNAFSNIKNAKVMLISEISGYDLLTGGKILLEKECLNYITEKWSK